MVRKRFVLAFLVTSITVLVLQLYSSRLSVEDEKNRAHQSYSAEYLVELAARSQRDEISKRHLSTILRVYGPNVANAAVRNFDNSWQQSRLYTFLSEMASDNSWKETFLRNARSPKATPVGDFDYTTPM
jgi:hypothetical protein